MLTANSSQDLAVSAKYTVLLQKYLILYFSLSYVLCVLRLAAHYCNGGKNTWLNLEAVYKGVGEGIEGQGAQMC